MAQMSLEYLGQVLRDRRGKRGIREVSAEIGISAATLSRIEAGRHPDLETFTKICDWLQVDPGEVLGTVTKQAKPAVNAIAHLRAVRNLRPETAQALGELILTLQKAIEDGTLP